jgi:hypothetical protein
MSRGVNTIRATGRKKTKAAGGGSYVADGEGSLLRPFRPRGLPVGKKVGSGDFTSPQVEGRWLGQAGCAPRGLPVGRKELRRRLVTTKQPPHCEGATGGLL